MRECHAQVEKGRVAGPKGVMYGAFQFTHPDTGRSLAVIASDGHDWAAAGLPGVAWEHVSVSPARGCPLWAEMCWVKSLFWGPEEWVMEFHPAAADYVNTHDRVLHLWKPVGGEFPKPPKECV